MQSSSVLLDGSEGTGMNITIDTREIEQLAKRVAGFSDRRFQSGLADALNKTARSVADEWAGQMRTKIDRPTSLTQRSVITTRADVGRLTAQISLRDAMPGPGLPPDVYLAPQEFGGDRRIKKFEQALQSRGAMPRGHKVVPGKYATLDGYGNISRGQIVAVLNQLGAELSVGYRKVISASAAKRATAAARSGRVYLPLLKDRGKLAAGIYEKNQGRLLPVFFFVSRTRYGKRLALQEHGQVIVQRELAPQVMRAIERRLESLLRRQSGASA